MTPNTAAVIDLDGLRRAIAALLDCYDTHLDGTDLNADALTRARKAIDRHLPIPGRLGRDLTVVLGHHPELDSRQVAESIERLRALSPPKAAPLARVATRRRERRTLGSSQPPLPGFEHGDSA